MRVWLVTGALAAAVGGAIGTGCGKGSDHASTTPPASTRASTSPPVAHGSRPPSSTHRSQGVALRVPRGWSAAPKRASGASWPVPRSVVSSFQIHRVSANALCPASVIANMPPDGVYLVVAEYTKTRPAGIPPRNPPGPRGDLTKLDIRPGEVECWDGLGGSASFREHGRDFRVEVLLGPQVSAAKRRRALQALASVSVAGPRP